MAAPVKKREIDQKSEDIRKDDAEDDASSGEENKEEVSDEQGMEIQVDFEGRNPQDPDYHGIKTLLQQLFLKAHIDLGGLTDLIISQNYVGSVVKQSDDVEGSDDEESDMNDVFGITTVINVSDKQHLPCVQQLRDLLEQLANEHANDKNNMFIQKMLKNESSSLGLLINERFINIPAQIAVPLFENLISEMKRACKKGMPFEFGYFVLICKLYKMERKDDDRPNKKKNRKSGEEPSVLWSNPEEEIFAEEATISFEFSVEKDSDSGLSGEWAEGDDEMTPYRRVLVIAASQLPTIIEKVKRQIS